MKGNNMSYQIRVNCNCGKILKIPEKYAGKRGRCPNCGKKIAIPSMDEIQNKIQATKDTHSDQERHCPTCGAYMNPGDHICVSCHTNLSTGEWNSDELAVQNDSNTKYYYWGALSLLALFILGITILLASNLSKKNNKETQLAPMPLEKTPASLLAQDEGKNLLEMKEESEKDIADKIASLESYIASKANKGVFENYQKLLLKQKEFQIEKKHKELELKNEMSHFFNLEKLIAEYTQTLYAKEKLLPEQKNVEQKIVALVKKEIEDLSDLFVAKSYDAIVPKAIDWMRQELIKVYPKEDFKDQVELLAEVAQKAYAEQTKKEASVVQAKPAAVETNLDSLRKEFNEFLAKYRNYQKSRSFSKAMKEIEPIAEKAKALKEKYAEDPDIIKILNTHKEIALLNKVWDYAVEGAVALKGKSKVLFVNNVPPVSGTILKYENGNVHIETKNNQVKEIALTDLASHSLSSLALHQNSKNAELHTALACFYYVSKEDSLCRDAVNNALKQGASSTDVEEYQKWSLAMLEESKKKLSDSERIKEEEQAKQQQNIEEVRLERIRRKAWNLVKTIIRDYKNHEETQVLEGLNTLKTEVGDEPGGRDELIKIHYIVKKEEGQGLKEMASNAFEYCNYCRNDGMVKCPDCKGEGKILGQERWLKGDKGIKITTPTKHCNRCKGSGEIYCPGCYDKRHNRRYILIKEYYNSF